jgi:rod shape-determining protein MreC
MRSTTRRYRVIGGILFLVVLALIVANSFGISGWTPRRLFQVEAGTRDTINSLDSPSSWKTERALLLEQLAQLKGLAQENQHLREALHFFEEKKYNYTIANVISRDPLSPSLVYADVGSDAGIVVGQPVVVGTGILVGKIVKVSSRNSTIELLTGDSARTLGNGARLEYIRDVKALDVGTILVTSGLEPLVPQGLLVGTVQKVSDNSDALFASADILPAADMAQLGIVSILRGL